MEYGRNHIALFFFGLLLAVIVHESTQQIPPQIWERMRDKHISSATEFLQEFIKKKPGHGQNPHSPNLEAPAGDAPLEDVIFTEEGTLAEGAGTVVGMVDVERDMCEVKRVSHEIPIDPLEPNVIYWPQCVKLDRCSGCCNNEMLECAPTLEQAIIFPVMRARYPFPGADYFEFEGIHDMVFSRHIECECRCRTQIEDCTAGLHRYDSQSCRCVCFNEWEAVSCASPKVWSNKECSCVCPPAGRLCYDDEMYSDVSCSCVRMTNGMQPPPPQHVSNGDHYCEQTIQCRAGFTARDVGGSCECVVGDQYQEQGSLIGPVNQGPQQYDRVPGSPQFVIRETTTQTPRPTRRPRATRRPRPSRPRNG